MTREKLGEKVIGEITKCHAGERGVTGGKL